MIYLLDPGDNTLAMSHEAGITDTRSREWIRSLRVPVGAGMFGGAVAERRVMITPDYPNDTSIRPRTYDGRGRSPTRALRSMVVAPLIAGDQSSGALGVYSRPDRTFHHPRRAA